MALTIAFLMLSGCFATPEIGGETPTPPTPTLTETIAPTASPIPTTTPILNDSIPLPSSDSAPIPLGARARFGLGSFHRLAVSPDRTRFAVAGMAGLYVYATDSFTQVWASPVDIDKNHEGTLRTSPWSGAWYQPWDVAWSPDGTVIAVGTGLVNGYRVTLHDAATGERLRTLFGPPDAGIFRGSDVLTWGELAFRPDGEVLATNGNWNTTAMIWDVATGAPLRSLQHTGWITDIEWLRDSSALATAGYDGQVSLWDGRTFEPIGRLEHPTITQTWENEMGETVEVVRTQSVWDIALSPDETMLVTHFSAPYTGGPANRALWDMETGEMLSEDAPDWFSYGVASPDGTSLSKRTASGEVVIIDLTTGGSADPGFTLEGQSYTNAFGWTSETTALVSSSSRVIHWDTRTGKMLDTLNAFDVPNTLVWSRDGSKIALVYSYDSMSPAYDTLVWDVQTGMPTRSVELWEDIAHDWASTHPTVDYADLERSAMVVTDRVDGKRLVALEPLPGRDYSFLFLAEASNEDYVAVGWGDGGLEVWDADSGEALYVVNGHSTVVRSIAFSPDGTRIASASGYDIMRLGVGASDYRSEIIIRDIGTGLPLLVMDGHDDAIYKVAWSPDGTILASASEDHIVILWNPVTGERLATLEGHTGGVKALAWSSDGATLASGSRDDTIILWDVAAVLQD